MKKHTIFLALIIFCITLFSGCSCIGQASETKYAMNLSFADGVISGVMDLTYKHTQEEPFSALKFNLPAKAFSKSNHEKAVAKQYENKAYYDGVNYGDTQVLAVKSGDKSIEYTVDERAMTLTVPLENELFKGESVSLSIEFSTTLAKVNHRLGVTQKTVNLADFYPSLCAVQDGAFYQTPYEPIGDPFFFDVADFDVSITFPQDYVIAGSGKILSSTALNGKRTNRYKISSARSVAFVLSKDFDLLTEKVDGVILNYYFYGERDNKTCLQTAIKAIKYFTETFGVYPYDTLSVVETPFVQGGMEYSGLVYISDELEPSAFNEVISHEIAHQWWYGGVGNNQTTYACLDEGLAEYSVLLFYENHPEYGFNREQLISSSISTYRAFCTVYDRLLGKSDTSMLRPLSEYSSEYEYVNINYVKPCIMLDEVRSLTGDKKFFSTLKQFYTKYYLKTATPYDLAGAFESFGGVTGGLFESYYDGKVVI